MKLSTKGRYGLRALIDLAVYCTEEAVSIQISTATITKINSEILFTVIEFQYFINFSFIFFTFLYIYSKRPDKFLLPVLAGAINGRFCVPYKLYI